MGKTIIVSRLYVATSVIYQNSKIHFTKKMSGLFLYLSDIRRMLALVKGGSSAFSCPRCTIPTEAFHLPYEFSFEDANTAIRTEEHMKNLYAEGKACLKNGQRTVKAAEHERKHSYHLVKVISSIQLTFILLSSICL